MSVGLSPADVARDLEAIRARLTPELRPLGLGGIDLGPGVLDRLPALIERHRRGDVVLLADDTPMRTRHGELKASLPADRRVTLHNPVHADAATLARATE